MKRKTLEARGTSEAIDALIDQIEKAKDAVGGKIGMNTNTGMASLSVKASFVSAEPGECPICGELVSGSYKLSLCGHEFCSDCMQDQIQYSYGVSFVPLRRFCDVCTGKAWIISNTEQRVSD